MKQPNTKRNFSPSEKRQIVIISILFGIGVLVLCFLLALVLRQNGVQLSLPALPVQATSTLAPEAVAPIIVVPTVVCGAPTFTLGPAIFQIQNLSILSDGSFTFPVDTPGVAYWLEGPEGSQLIALSPTPDNIFLETTITIESTAKFTRADCSSMTFGLSAPEPNLVHVSTLPSQLTSGLTIFFQTDSAGNGLIVRGEITEMIFP